MKSQPQILSVIIITHNEGHQLAACLDSVCFADEIVIVDSESTDNTVEIAKQYTQKVYNQPWQGFGHQKQIALNYATGDWVLSLDADEVLSPELQGSIQALLASPLDTQCTGYTLCSVTNFCGTYIQHGDWRRETKLRLFQRSKGHFTEDVVHEKLVVSEDRLGALPGIFYHYSYPNLEMVLEKIQRYSTLGAEKKWAAGKKASFATALGHGLWAFVRGYIIKGGFLDGVAGFLVACSRMEETFYRYMNLRALGLNTQIQKIDMP
jgi:glycosyltransferase involved in cell wall biosynthesis